MYPSHIVDCRRPTFSNGILNGDTVFDGNATIECDAGYSGGGTATCLDTGRWATLPLCYPTGKSPTLANAIFAFFM